MLLPVCAIRQSDAPKLAPVRRARGVVNGRLRHLNDLGDERRTYVDCIRAVVPCKGIPAASQEHNLVAPEAAREMTGQASFSRCREDALIGITHDKMIR